MSARRVIVVQYWSGDREAALRLGRFISEMEPAYNPDVEILFAARFDAAPPDEMTLKVTSKKFRVHTFISPNHGAGHPWGCWVLWWSVVEWALKETDAGRPIKWLMTIEADSVPLTRDWITQLDAEWDRQGPNIRMMGAAHPGGYVHVNGNQFVSGNPDMLCWLVREYGISGLPPDGWDVRLFPEFLRWGCSYTDKMVSICRVRGAAMGFGKKLRDGGVVFYHGVKDDSLIREVRRTFFKKA